MMDLLDYIILLLGILFMNLIIIFIFYKKILWLMFLKKKKLKAKINCLNIKKVLFLLNKEINFKGIGSISQIEFSFDSTLITSRNDSIPNAVFIWEVNTLKN